MWNKKSVAKFWEGCTAEQAGDTSAPEIIELSKKYIGKRVLDAGAGSGALIKRIPNAIGLDLAPKHRRIIKGNVLDMPFKNKIFDTVFATELLEHLDDDALDKGLSELSRVLRKGGYLIVTTPYKEDVRQNMVLCPNCRTWFHRWGHQQIFDEKKMKEILERKGFELVEIRILPLGLLAKHKFIKHFRGILKKLEFLQSSNNLFVVARK